MNELTIIDKIGTKLQETREPTIFPLTPTHRKELRQLRDRNIGDLRDRLTTLETLKREEYEKKYAKQIELELKRYEGILDKLNTDWINRIKKLNNLLDERKKLEEKSDIKKLNLHNDYSDISKLEKVKYERTFSLDRKQKALDIAREEFGDKYDEKFNEVRKKIDEVVTHYEEAINFGDLEIVKKIYYLMKKSDDFFKKISELKI